MKSQKVIFNLYNFAWKIALPLLKKNSVFKESYQLRVSSDTFKKTDIWIHGASGGEAYIAIEILKKLNPSTPLKILYTATTLQGLQTMESFCKSSGLHPNINYQITWFPFDGPKSMEKIVLKTSPSLMVILETELWPGHLYILKKHKIKTLIINARLSSKSYKWYLRTKTLWQQINPDNILATSQKDAERYKKIFAENTIVDTMPNIKFDAIPAIQNNPDDTFSIESFFTADIPLSILASIRKEEEIHLPEIIRQLITNFPNQIIAIFPKHIQRIKALSDLLDNLALELPLPWQLRSKINSPVDKTTIILWDTFGELKKAYALAVSAFVGGSLEPLGGQNFLEPVICGTATVTGPFLNSFKWVNREIFETNIVHKAQNAMEVCDFMVEKLKTPPDRKKLQKKAVEFIRKNQGGTAMAVKLINDQLHHQVHALKLDS